MANGTYGIMDCVEKNSNGKDEDEYNDIVSFLHGRNEHMDYFDCTLYAKVV